MNERSKTNLLIVDDELSIVEVAREYFQVKGYHVHTAGSGEHAIEIIQKERIDCCFTDINMPGMDGLELAEHIRRFDNSIPVIVMTGYPSLDVTIKTLKNGVVDFLVKPVNLSQMELSLQRVMRERRLFVENLLLQEELEQKERLEKLNQELMVKVEELNILNQIMDEFAATGSSSDVFRRTVELTAEVTHADVARFFLVNDNLQQPFMVASANGKPASKQARPDMDFDLKQAEPLIMETVADRIPLLISDSKGIKGLPESIGSFMVVPLTIREKIFGVLMAAARAGETPFSEKDLYYLSYITHKAANAIENLALYENIYENLFATLYAFVKAIEARDTYTQQHSERVTLVALEIGKYLGCGSEDLDILNTSGMLHDIGKIGIPDGILLKPGKLTDAEFEQIKKHPVIGGDIVAHLGLWDREQEIIRHHHERIDGTGYPDRLAGDAIPLLSRILSVADTYDAMTSDRPYRKGMPVAKCLRIIQECAGSQFDPDIVDAFLKVHAQGLLEPQTAPAA